MITVENLVKRYGHTTAVNNLSFALAPGKVTGFLGPNGSGKSTTMRCIVGLDRPTSGHCSIGGVEYSQLKSPITTVGALLDGKAFHPKRTARQQLRVVARTHGIPDKRVDDVLELTGIAQVADKRLKGFSLGMGQRLGIATALLGDPEVLLFDEPVNGLDPDGVRWVRELMRNLAGQGRTVLVSSHLMSEMAQTADHLLVIGRGRILTSGPVDEVIAASTTDRVRVASPQASALAELLGRQGIVTAPAGPSLLETTAATAAQVGEAAAAAGIVLHELTTVHASLEDAYLTLTNGEVEYRTDGASPAAPAPAPTPAPAAMSPAEEGMK